MIASLKIAPIAGLIAVLGLSACSGGNIQRDAPIRPFSVVKSLFSRPAPPPPVDAAAMSAALNNVSGPVMQIRLTGREASAFFVPIEENGAYRTWSSPDERTVTLKSGMLTASRGLGQDTMSTSADSSLQLVRQRKNGIARRIQRYLTPDNQTVELVAECEIENGGRETYRGGVVSASVTRMTESCVSDGMPIENAYLVDDRGTILFARQYLSPANGYGLMYTLRR
ncbi:hypothetical protein GLS40_01330 [Pseudooceanicola sp. 216_PA32_1]|uniref:Group 4 capsule polysaccharide lipoprotein gfcB, YjbF n=1 Tax=Pseudooceanicola pacificus TaxID=2676438 RepID=A0A844WBJ3_9RHOB|nr:YjbF family lipoprotein [Pseudooceanicola pacificus]MWB76660.1 hypothetical protein [Pseudooceanicola pacificus]